MTKKGKIIFNGKEKFFDCTTDLPVAAVELILECNSNTTIKELNDLIKPVIFKYNHKDFIVKANGFNMKDRKHYKTSRPITVLDENGSYVDTYINTNYDDQSIYRFISGIKNLGFSVEVEDEEISKLREHNEELFKLYNMETDYILSIDEYEKLSHIKVIIDKSNDVYFEIVGRYYLYEIIEEIESILNNNESVGEFRNYLRELLNLLHQLSNLEYKCQLRSEESVFLIVNGIHYITKDYKISIKEIENEINSLIEKIKELLDSHRWPKETRKLIKDILNRICPKIASRKRISSVLGTFNASKFIITLYEKAIDEWLPNIDLDKKMLDVYSHELFHAYHYIHMKDTTKWKYDDDSRIVVESLARYIEYKFSIFGIKETELTSDLIRMWNDYDMFDFPYAGAKYLEHYLGLSRSMFEESTLSGTKKAFHLIKKAYKLK